MPFYIDSIYNLYLECEYLHRTYNLESTILIYIDSINHLYLECEYLGAKSLQLRVRITDLY
jgi:hypothetical protein